MNATTLSQLQAASKLRRQLSQKRREEIERAAIDERIVKAQKKAAAKQEKKREKKKPVQRKSKAKPRSVPKKPAPKVEWKKIKHFADAIGEPVVKDLNKPTNQVMPDEQPITNYTINTDKRPPAEYSNKSPYGIASDLHLEK